MAQSEGVTVLFSFSIMDQVTFAFALDNLSFYWSSQVTDCSNFLSDSVVIALNCYGP